MSSAGREGRQQGAETPRQSFRNARLWRRTTRFPKHAAWQTFPEHSAVTGPDPWSPSSTRDAARRRRTHPLRMNLPYDWRTLPSRQHMEKGPCIRRRSGCLSDGIPRPAHRQQNEALSVFTTIDGAVFTVSDGPCDRQQVRNWRLMQDRDGVLRWCSRSLRRSGVHRNGNTGCFACAFDTGRRHGGSSCHGALMRSERVIAE